MAQVATLIPPSQVIYRQLLNTRSALVNQGHTPIFADELLRQELTRYLADRALESSAGALAERDTTVKLLDGHLARRGRAEVLEREAAHNADSREYDGSLDAARGIGKGLSYCVGFLLLLGLAVHWL